jgi:hypothetical protein
MRVSPVQTTASRAVFYFTQNNRGEESMPDNLTITVSMRLPWWFKIVGKSFAKVLHCLMWLKVLSNEQIDDRLRAYVYKTCWFKVDAGVVAYAGWQRLTHA